MRKLLVGLLTFGLVGLIPSTQVTADNRPSFGVCTSSQSSNCIVSLEVKGPGLSDFVALPMVASNEQGPIFSTENIGYSPANGANRLSVTANEISWPQSGNSIAQLQIGNAAGQNILAGLDVDTIYRVTVNLGTQFPGPAYGALDRGSYKFTKLGSIYQMIVESKPLASRQTGWDMSCMCPTQVATSESIGTWSLSFIPPFGGMWVDPANTNNPVAWFAVETNAGGLQFPTFGNGVLSIRVDGPHFKVDGVTLNQGTYRLVMNNTLVTSGYQMSREQALSGALVALTAELGSALTGIGAKVNVVDSEYLELVLDPFHYSTRDVAVKGSLALKSSSLTWSGKKSSVKRNKALTVKAAVKSNKKKAAGTMRVDLLNSAGAVVATLNGNVKKGSGKVTFSKAVTKGLAPGKYTVKINFYGTGTAKNTSRSYGLKVK